MKNWALRQTFSLFHHTQSTKLFNIKMPKIILSILLLCFCACSCLHSAPDCGALQSVTAQANKNTRYDETYLRQAKPDAQLKAIFDSVNLFKYLDIQDEGCTWGGYLAHFVLSYEKRTYVVSMACDENQFTVRELYRNRPNSLNKTEGNSIHLESPELYSALSLYLREHPPCEPPALEQGNLWLVASMKSWRVGDSHHYYSDNTKPFDPRSVKSGDAPEEGERYWPMMRGDVNEWLESIPKELMQELLTACSWGGAGEILFIPGRRVVQHPGLIAGSCPLDLYLPAMFATQDDLPLAEMMDQLQLLYQLHDLGYIRLEKVDGEHRWCWTSKAYEHQGGTMERKKGLTLWTLPEELEMHYEPALSLIGGNVQPALLYSVAEHREGISYALDTRRANEGYNKALASNEQKPVMEWGHSCAANEEQWLQHLDQQSEMASNNPSLFQDPLSCWEITLKDWVEPSHGKGARSEYRIFSFPKGDIKSYYKTRRQKPIISYQINRD